MFTVGEYIVIASFLITVGTMLWRMALITAKVDTNAREVERAHNRIDELKKTSGDRMDEVVSQLMSIRDMQARMDERLTIFMALLEKGMIK